MQTFREFAVMMARFNMGGGEIILILALVLILFGARRLPELGRGLRRGILLFGKATKDVADEIDGEAEDAGRSLGGIYGKPAAQAITPENMVAELYNPEALQRETQRGKQGTGLRAKFRRIWSRLSQFASQFFQKYP